MGKRMGEMDVMWAQQLAISRYLCILMAAIFFFPNHLKLTKVLPRFAL
jgi:hypothetical protein